MYSCIANLSKDDIVIVHYRGRDHRYLMIREIDPNDPLIGVVRSMNHGGNFSLELIRGYQAQNQITCIIKAPR